MSRDIQIIGGDEAVRNIARRVDRNRINDVVRKSTAQVQRKAMRDVPVDTGFLKRSITIEMDTAHMQGTVTAGAEYGAYVEFGTRYMGAQPFMRPARNEQEPIFLSDLQKLIRRG